MKKKIVLVIAAAAALLALAGVILFNVVDADSFRGFIEAKAEENLGRDVRLGTIGLSVVPVFGLQVDDVAVTARPGEGDGDLLTLRSLRIGARLIPLLKKRLEVTSIVLVEPAINLVRDVDGNWNFDVGAGGDASEDVGQTAKPGAAPEVTVDAIRVTGGSLRVRDASRSQAQPFDVALTDLDLEISAIGIDEFRMAVENGRLEVSDPALGPDPLLLGVGAIDLAVRGGGDSVELTRCELVVGKTTVALTGTVEAQPDGRQDRHRSETDQHRRRGHLVAAGKGRRRIRIVHHRQHTGRARGGCPRRAGGEPPARTEHPGKAERDHHRRKNPDPAGHRHQRRGDAAGHDGRGRRFACPGRRQRLRRYAPAHGSQAADARVHSRVATRRSRSAARPDGGRGKEGTDRATPPDPDSFVVRGIADGSLKVAEGSWVNLHFRDLDARLRLENGVATLDPVSMGLYDGRFNGRLASDLTRVPQSFEFSGEAENIDMDPFVADQTGMSDILMGRFTGRVAGQGAGTDSTTVIRSLEGEGVARIIDGQVGKLDVLRSVGQVAGVLGQRTLANLASESATGATRFSQLVGDFRIAGGALSFDSVLLRSAGFDLTGTGTVDMISSVMNGEFLLQFSPEVSAWMKQESSRAAELFWDSGSGRVVLPLGLSGTLDSARASVDWGAAAEDVARRTVERELTNALDNLLGGSRDNDQDKGAVTSPDEGSGASAAKPSTRVKMRNRQAKAPSGRFAIRLVKTEWVGPSSEQHLKITCKVMGAGVERALMKVVDAGGGKVQNATVDLAPLLAEAGAATFEVRVNGKNLAAAESPVTVTLTASAADGETATLILEIE